LLYREALGQVLKQIRLEQGLTLRKASSKAPMALGYLCEIENGHKEISSEVLERLAFSLKTDVSEVAIQTGLRLAGHTIPDTITDLINEMERVDA
jgi:transcriptional regulator with XRE-family HTH domain